MDDIRFSVEKSIRAGVYRNINFEVMNWIMEGRKIWNFYLYIPEESLENKKIKRLFKKAEKIDYEFRKYNYEILDDLFDMHGGITYMSIEFHPKKYYVLGCDYAHYGDDDVDWGFNLILKDVKHSIDYFLKKMEV